MWTNTIKHLGHILFCTLNDSVDISHQLDTFTSQFNYFMARFSNVSVILKVKLFSNYCESLYGCQLWDLQHADIEGFDTVWRKSIRRLWRIPYRTHCNILPVFANGQSFRSILCKRFSKFASDCLGHANNLIACISKIASVSQLHAFGKNTVFVGPFIVGDLALCACELRLSSTGLFYIDGFSPANIKDMLYSVCCD